MNNESLRKIFSLTDDEYARVTSFMEKVRDAQLMYCELHDIEWFDFEPGCYACIQEREEFQAEMNERKARKEGWRAKT